METKVPYRTSMHSTLSPSTGSDPHIGVYAKNPGSPQWSFWLSSCAVQASLCDMTCQLPETDWESCSQVSQSVLPFPKLCLFHPILQMESFGHTVCWCGRPHACCTSIILQGGAERNQLGLQSSVKICIQKYAQKYVKNICMYALSSLFLCPVCLLLCVLCRGKRNYGKLHPMWLSDVRLTWNIYPFGWHGSELEVVWCVAV